MNIDFNFAQAVGLAAMTLWAGSFSTKSNKRLNQIWVVSNSFWVLHYILLAAWSGAVNNSVNIIRSLAILFIKNPRWRPPVFFGLVLLYIAVTLPFIHKFTDVFPLAASLLTCWAFYVSSVLFSRWLLVASSSGWLVYGIVSHSIGAVVAAIISIAIGLITILRLWREHKLKPVSPPAL